MSIPLFRLAEVYDAMIDWPRRLAHETPLYRWLLARAAGSTAANVHRMSGAEPSTSAAQDASSQAQAADAPSPLPLGDATASAPAGAAEGSFSRLRLLDAACGVGRHAELLHRWSVEVEAADISPEMIQFARQRYGEPPGLRWVVRGFEQPVEAAGSFDLAICVGNSLALAPDLRTAQQAVGQLLSALRPGGLLLVHLLNQYHLPDGPVVWQKCQRSRLSWGEVLIVKGVRRWHDRGSVELLVIGLPQAELLHAESAMLLALSPQWLESTARQAGAGQIEFYGGYDRQPYQPQQSTDLLMVAAKR